eukprot:gene10944-biopygen1800
MNPECPGRKGHQPQGTGGGRPPLLFRPPGPPRPPGLPGPPAPHGPQGLRGQRATSSTSSPLGPEVPWQSGVQVPNTSKTTKECELEEHRSHEIKQSAIIDTWRHRNRPCYTAMGAIQELHCVMKEIRDAVLILILRVGWGGRGGLAPRETHPTPHACY